MKKFKWEDECTELLTGVLCELDIMNTEKKAYLQNRIKGFLSGKGGVSKYDIAKELGLTYGSSVDYLIQKMDRVFVCEDSPNKVYLADEGK